MHVCRDYFDPPRPELPGEPELPEPEAPLLSLPLPLPGDPLEGGLMSGVPGVEGTPGVDWLPVPEPLPEPGAPVAVLDSTPK